MLTLEQICNALNGHEELDGIPSFLTPILQITKLSKDGLSADLLVCGLYEENVDPSLSSIACLGAVSEGCPIIILCDTSVEGNEPSPNSPPWTSEDKKKGARLALFAATALFLMGNDITTYALHRRPETLKVGVIEDGIIEILPSEGKMILKHLKEIPGKEN